jgi:hypothetical protein
VVKYRIRFRLIFAPSAPRKPALFLKKCPLILVFCCGGVALRVVLSPPLRAAVLRLSMGVHAGLVRDGLGGILPAREGSVLLGPPVPRRQAQAGGAVLSRV